jgi:hypothetical protein
MPPRALTALVIFLGVAIVAGFAALAVGIAGRAARHPATRAAAPPARSQAAGATPFAAPPIDLPRGARVAAIGAGTDRLVLDLALPDGSQQLVIIDLATGRRLGTVPLHAAP